MNILVTGTTFPRWDNDNVPTFVEDLSKRLAIEGNNITVLAPHYLGAKFHEQTKYLDIQRFRYFLEKYQKLVYGGILPNIKKNPFLVFQAPFLIFFEILTIRKLIKKKKIDAIHSHWILPQGFCGAFIKRFIDKEVKHIITVHAGGVLALKKIPFKRIIADFIIKNTDAITCVSTYMKNELLNTVSPDLRSELIKKTKIIPMGVYIGSFRINKNKNYLRKKYKVDAKWSILFIGRLAEKKGVKYLLETIRNLKNIDVELLIAGDGPLRQDLESLTKNYNLEEKVKFLGYASKDMKLELFSVADIIVIPSIITKSGDTEGFPVVMLESFASKKPLIITNVGGVSDALKNNVNGILIKQKNVKQIENAIRKIVNNPKFSRKISKKAYETAKKYDWKIIGKRYSEIIKH